MQNPFSLKCLNWATSTRIKRIAIALVLFLIADKQAALAMPASMPEAASEIIATSWDDNEVHYACVTLNGKELLRLKESADAGSDVTVAEKAEDMAAKLDGLVKNKKFSADKLYPVTTKEGVVFKVEGTELFKLSAVELANSVSIAGTPVKQSVLSDDQDGNTKASNIIAAKAETNVEPTPRSLEYGLKIANAIRMSFGAKALPLSFLKLAEFTARRSVDSMAAIAAAGASVTGHFSGNASWYGPHFHGRKCSDGTIFNQNGLTAAHRSLPFGTKLLVMNRRTGDSCVVKVNDRGPFVGGRVIDLSKGAAQQLNMLSSGVAMVDCIVLGKE